MFFGIDLVQILQVVGYPGIFAMILAESGLFFGVGLPGGSLFFTAGLLASQEYLNIWILLAVGITAAIIGDSIGYWFGSWVGPALFKREDSRFFKKKYLFQTKEFFDKHGSSTIFLARFVPIIRTFAPILAGVAEMDYKAFLFYNAAGAVVWGGGFTMAGYILGNSIPSAKDYLEYLILGIVVVTSLPLLFQFRKTRKSISPNAHVGLTKAKAVIFDLDETLAESTVPPTDAMLAKVFALSSHVNVSVMSGAPHERIDRDVIQRIWPPKGAKDIFVFSDSGAQCKRLHEGQWVEAYSFPIAPDEQKRITTAIEESIEETEVYKGAPNTARIITREMSVALAALPKEATHLEKKAWDPDREKRTKLMYALRKRLHDYEVRIGGACTIDITREGINKAHSVEWLAKELDYAPSDMLFIGDAFYTGGNDAIVIPTGIQTLQTSGPKETESIIDDLLKTFQHAKLG